ncbi:hypothetical protein ACCAA_350135 [Candidatus Accumulibacter aalborgensis]|uniref:Uncharacterized protein n=1 Tax=Candidatus Accumulibacter aalborgensis TaxID=1860102 RepID=A0A1A8XNM9_9PROT|nr:hypothetical protein ACCAA_350135 [Candidatus Accumulibacter aalborgensis]
MMAMNGLLGVVTPNGRSLLLYNSDLGENRGTPPFHRVVRRSLRFGETDSVIYTPCRIN